jgi:hypothetical protein
MNLIESYNTMMERLKFPFYSTQETEIRTSIDTSQTTAPENIEFSPLSYNPFGSMTNSDFNSTTAFSMNRNELIRRWREVSYLPEVTMALREICNEAIVYDEIEDAISLNLADVELPDEIKLKIEDSFNKILYMLDFSRRGDELFKQWYVDGVLNVEVVFNNARLREGIKQLILLSPFNFIEFVDETTQKKSYFYSDTGTYNPQMVLKDPTKLYTEEQITTINSGESSIDRKYPIGYLNPILKTINQLTNIEDTLVIARITRSTEKRMFKIPIYKMPKSKAEEYIRSVMLKYRQKKIYNTDMGTIENKNRAVSILEDFFFPTDAAGVGPTVEILPGQTQGFASFEDVDYFVNKLYKALYIPTSRRSADSRTTISNQIDIEKDELKFFKHILKLRRKFNNMFTDLLKKDLIAQNVLSLEDWITIQDKIKFAYANSNEYSEIKQNQIIAMRIDTANSAIGLLEPQLISAKYIQTNILRLTDEEIREIKIENDVAEGKTPEEGEGDFGGDDFGGGAEDFGSSGDDSFEAPSPPDAEGEMPIPDTPSTDTAKGAAVPQATTGKP